MWHTTTRLVFVGSCLFGGLGLPIVPLVPLRPLSLLTVHGSPTQCRFPPFPSRQGPELGGREAAADDG